MTLSKNVNSMPFWSTQFSKTFRFVFFPGLLYLTIQVFEQKNQLRSWLCKMLILKLKHFVVSTKIDFIRVC